MSDYLPLEIQVQIITRLPVKSLIQFRTVSKEWKSFIDTSTFITDYIRHHKHAQHLLVSYTDALDSQLKYDLLDDDATFPLHRVSVPVSPLLNSLMTTNQIKQPIKGYIKVGCSHGLLCLHGIDPVTQRGMVVLWNLTIRKSVGVVVPKGGDERYGTSLGFGVCRETIDPKIVKITQTVIRSPEGAVVSGPRKVEVFTLSTGVWRPSLGSKANYPRELISFTDKSLEVNGVLYWLAVDLGYEPVEEDEDDKRMVIVSFDMTSEEFDEVNLWHNYVNYHINLYEIRESLVLVEDSLDCVLVWMMEDGVPKSSIKAFTILKPEYPYAVVRGFRNNAAPVVEVLKVEEADCKAKILVVYEPYANCIDKHWIQVIGFSTFVIPYMETLLLHDKPDLMVYNDDI